MRKESGMTLIELLVAITVLTILLSLGVPSFKEFIKNNRVSAQANDFVTAVQLARIEAVKRGTDGVVCVSTDQSECANNDTTDWSSGWIVYSDFQRDGALSADAAACNDNDDCILLTRGPLSNNNTLVVDTSAAPPPADNDLIRFVPTGLTDNGPFTFQLVAEDCAHKQMREITISQHGQTSTREEACP